VFADIDEKTFNISPDEVLDKITPKTKAIIPVHYGGQPCDMKELTEVAKDHKLSIVEDCAHSLGAKYRDQQTGTFGIMGCFSFYPTKMITTLEGGMVTTNDEKIDKRLRLLREHGMNRTAIQREQSSAWSYDIVDLGYNYRLTEAQAALGISQLKRIDEGIRMRIRAASYYTIQLGNGDPDVLTPYIASDRSHVFHLYTIRIQKKPRGTTRNAVFKRLGDFGIQSSVHYTPLHLMSFYKQFLTGKSLHFPIAERIYEEILSLPLYPTLTKKQVRLVSKKTKEILSN
jgi:dTDP-4-amino-4,6-dideoxygalactose transaminase